MDHSPTTWREKLPPRIFTHVWCPACWRCTIEGGSNPWFSTKYITTQLLLLLVLKDFTKYNFRVLWSTQTYSKYWGFYDFSVCWGGGGGRRWAEGWTTAKKRRPFKFPYIHKTSDRNAASASDRASSRTLTNTQWCFPNSSSNPWS